MVLDAFWRNYIARWVLPLPAIPRQNLENLKPSRKEAKVSRNFVLIACVCLFGLGVAEENNDPIKVIAPPKELRLDPFYKKYLDADGIPIISSEKVDDKAFIVAHEIIIKMLSKRDDIKKAMVENKARVAIRATSEKNTDIPEYKNLSQEGPGQGYPFKHWNQYDGIGGTKDNPICCAGEDNSDLGKSILAHEIGHSILNLGITNIDGNFVWALKQAYKEAVRKGIWKDTYAEINVDEYWAEGVRFWFNANAMIKPTFVRNNFGYQGFSKPINAREALKKYDPDLAGLLAQVFPDDEWRYSDKITIAIKVSVKLTIFNNTDQKAYIYWINRSGDRIFYYKLGPNSSYTQPTYAGRKWRALIGDDGNQVNFVAPAEDATWKLK